jgi:DNA-binding Lrp family transcriptional regulator
MDFFDERILEALKDGSQRTFPALLGQVGFSHNTLQHHLKRLTAKRVVIKQKTRINGFGSPGSRIKYHLAAGNR